MTQGGLTLLFAESRVQGSAGRTGGDGQDRRRHLGTLVQGNGHSIVSAYSVGVKCFHGAFDLVGEA